MSDVGLRTTEDSVEMHLGQDAPEAFVSETL